MSSPLSHQRNHALNQNCPYAVVSFDLQPSPKPTSFGCFHTVLLVPLAIPAAPYFH